MSGMWEGELCAVLAAGPSMSVEVADAVQRAGARSIAVNGQAISINKRPAIAPWADVLYAADSRWWFQNVKEARAFKGARAAIQMGNGVFPSLPEDLDITVYRNGGPFGLDNRPGFLRTGHNSGYQAVHLAYNFGAKRIVLCGFDMHNRGGEHWFGDYAWRPKYSSRYSLFLTAFNRVAPEYRARGVEIINATPGSALKCFPAMELEDALRFVRSGATAHAVVSPETSGGIGTQVRGAAGAKGGDTVQC